MAAASASVTTNMTAAIPDKKEVHCRFCAVGGDDRTTALLIMALWHRRFLHQWTMSRVLPSAGLA
jgi:hypothetical protein